MADNEATTNKWTYLILHARISDKYNNGNALAHRSLQGASCRFFVLSHTTSIHNAPKHGYSHRSLPLPSLHTTTTMFRPIFSSSHSAKWLEQRAELDSNDRNIGAEYWVQKGISAHGEVWTTQSEAESETVVDELEGDDVRDDEGGLRPSLVRRGKPDTLDAEATSSHGGGRSTVSRPHAALNPSLRSQPPRLQVTRMAPKTHWWISLWYVRQSIRRSSIPAASRVLSSTGS